MGMFNNEFLVRLSLMICSSKALIGSMLASRQMLMSLQVGVAKCPERVRVHQYQHFRLVPGD